MTAPRTRIVATLGPATDRPGVLDALSAAGVDVFRLNLSHGTLCEQRRRLGQVVGLTCPRAVLIDTRGPEVRMSLSAPVISAGDEMEILASCFTLPEVVSHLQAGHQVALGDEGIVLEVLESLEDRIRVRALAGGQPGGRARVTLPPGVEDAVMEDRPVLTAHDRRDILDLVPRGADFIALSLIRSAGDVLDLRRLLEDNGLDAAIVAKIETRQAVVDVDAIMAVSDGLMIARGDLGLRLPPEDVPIIQKDLIRRAGRDGIPVITATQMLESMISAPSPTRAEASDVANAIIDGTDAVMLSGETAIGDYPVEAVSMMARIAIRAEGAVAAYPRPAVPGSTMTDAVGRAASQIAADLGAAAIITATRSGYTARMVARFRPQARLVAVTPSPRVARQLSLVWGVEALVMEPAYSADDVMDQAVAAAMKSGLVRGGDLIVLTAGLPPGTPGTTNLLRVEVAAHVLARGAGIGDATASGPVFSPGGGEPPERFILVAETTDADMVPLMKRSSGIVAGQGGLTSHAAVVGLNLSLPTVVGADLGELRPGRMVTVDAARGLIYEGEVSVPGKRSDERGKSRCS